MPWMSRRGNRVLIVACAMCVPLSVYVYKRCFSSSDVTTQIESVSVNNVEDKHETLTKKTMNPDKPPANKMIDIPGNRGDDVKFLHWLRDFRTKMGSDFVLKYLSSSDSSERKVAVLESYMDVVGVYEPRSQWRETIIELLRDGKSSGDLNHRISRVLRSIVNSDQSEAQILRDVLSSQEWPESEKAALIYGIGDEKILIDNGVSAPEDSVLHSVARSGLESIHSKNGLLKLAESETGFEARKQTVLSIGRVIDKSDEAELILGKVSSIDPDKSGEYRGLIVEGISQSSLPGRTKVVLDEWKKTYQKCIGRKTDYPGAINAMSIGGAYWSERKDGHDVSAVERDLREISVEITDLVARYPKLSCAEWNLYFMLENIAKTHPQSDCSQRIGERCSSDPFRMEIENSIQEFFKKDRLANGLPPAKI